MTEPFSGLTRQRQGPEHRAAVWSLFAGGENTAVQLRAMLVCLCMCSVLASSVQFGKQFCCGMPGWFMSELHLPFRTRHTLCPRNDCEDRHVCVSMLVTLRCRFNISTVCEQAQFNRVTLFLVTSAVPLSLAVQVLFLLLSR